MGQLEGGGAGPLTSMVGAGPLQFTFQLAIFKCQNQEDKATFGLVGGVRLIHPDATSLINPSAILAWAHNWRTSGDNSFKF
jgi:hypothetical protein